MLSENQVVKSKSAARKAIESTYCGVCDIVEYESFKEKKSSVTRHRETVKAENAPCRLSFEKIAAAVGSDTGAAVTQGVKLFIAPEAEVKSGSKIIVSQNGITNAYSASGQAAVYESHKEIMLELWKGWLKTGKSGFDVSGLKKLQKELEKLKEKAEPFAEECTKDLGKRVLRRVIKRTPVGVYDGSTYTCESGLSHKSSKQKGKVGGTLRRGWTSKTHAEAESGGKGNAKEYAASLPVKKEGNKLTLDIVNPVEYASYVEYGHRKRGGKGWVQGHFMLEKSRQEVEKIAPKVIEAKLNKFLGGGFK